MYTTCARYIVATQLGPEFVTNNLYPNMDTAAKKLLAPMFPNLKLLASMFPTLKLLASMFPTIDQCPKTPHKTGTI